MYQNFFTKKFSFDIQRFATGTAVKIGGVVNNVEVGDTFTVDGAKYTVLAVEKNSVTALVNGTPAEKLGNHIDVGDGKSIDGVTHQTTVLEDVDSDIIAKCTYKLDIAGNAVFVTVFGNEIEIVTDSKGNTLSASGDKYTVGSQDFTLKLDEDGIPIGNYNGTDALATTLIRTIYSFSVDKKPVEVVVANKAINSVSIDSKNVGTAAGTYSVGDKKLKVSYAKGTFTAEVASPTVIDDITPLKTYKIGNTTVTVDSNGKLSQNTATINGHTASLKYDSSTKQVIASYSSSSSSSSSIPDPSKWTVTLLDDTKVEVKIGEENRVSSVTMPNGEQAQQIDNSSKWKIPEKPTLTLKYESGTLTATQQEEVTEEFVATGALSFNVNGIYFGFSYAGDKLYVRYQLEENTGITDEVVTLNGDDEGSFEINGVGTITVKLTHRPNLEAPGQDDHATGTVTYLGDKDLDEKMGTTAGPSHSSHSTFRWTVDPALMTYTFKFGEKDVSVEVDSTGKMTYKGKTVTNNKITVDGVEITFDMSGTTVTRAKYYDKYSPVEYTSVDVYKATIDGQTVELTFDENNQCNVEVNGKKYLVTKTADGATIASDKTSIGVEESRIYMFEVDDKQYWINCTFDAAGNLKTVTSDDKNLAIDGTTIKFGDYTVKVSGTKDALKTSATLTVYGEETQDVEVNPAFVLSGIKTTDGITLKDNVVMLTGANLNNQDVTIEGDGYTLALDKDYAPAIAAGEHFEGFTYKSESNTDGYEIASGAKLIKYIEESPATDLFTLYGAKSTDGITVKNGVVTLSDANLKKQDVTIVGDGYTLALDKNYAPAIAAGEHFEGFTYKSESNTDGYEVADDKKLIDYIEEVPPTDLFTLSGISTTKGITVENNIVTLSNRNLQEEDAKIYGDGYTLALNNEVKEPTFDEGGWTLSGTTASYKSESNTAGYTLSDDAKVANYTPENEPDTSLKVYGVVSLEGLSLSGNTVTVAAVSLDKQTVTISKGYYLAMAEDVEQPTKRGKYWTQLDEDTYLYTAKGITAGYTLKNNKITYSDEFVSGEQYTIRGAAGTELISETDDIEDVEEDSLSRRKVVLIETDEHNPENNLDFYTENYAQVKIASGQDSLITYDGARSKVDMADADNVTVVSFDGKVQLDNYDVESGSVVLVQDINDIIDAIKTNKIKLVGNEIWINFSSRVAINNPNNDSTVVELVNYDGEKQLVGFTGKNGGTLDMSEFDEDAVLKGNYSENSPETKYIGSVLKGGAGDDMLLAGSRDYADGGEGRNEIYLTPYKMRYKKDGATVVSRGNSRNNVYNFHEGFGYDGDYVQVENLSDVNFEFEDDGLSIGSENSRMKLKGVGVNSSSADAVSDFGAENPELILLTDGETTLKSAIAKTDESILVTEKDGLKPNAFFGNRSGLNFSAYGGTVEINLADGTGALGGRDAIFKGINKIQAGDGLSRLIGSDENNTLIAGNGYTSLAGGAGTDELFGRSSSADKAGRTEFLYFEGDGRDVIYDFEFLTAENKNSGTADKIGVDTLVTKISCSGNDVVLQVNNSDENLTIKDAAGKTFQINDLILKVDKNIVYDGLANCYIADGGSLVSVDSSVDSAEIWLDNSHGTAFVGEIKTLDASAVDGKTSLAGNAFDNTIIAGNGDSSLWGGDFGDDLLVGGSGKNTFFYNFGNGNDTIQNAKASDVVDLTNITLNEISAEIITDSGVKLEFSDGGTLTVNGTDCEYRVAGTSYVVDNGKWKIK